MADTGLRTILDVAMEAAYVAGRRTLAYFDAGVAVETKPDNTPVTRADREAEEIICSYISRYFPGHSILGEEHGQVAGDPEYRWLIDPIDGTKAFIRGVPFYGTLIGVVVRGQPAVGVAYLPALDEMVEAAAGWGCRRNGRTARVSAVSALEDAALMVTSVRDAMKRSDAYERLAARTRLQRTWGDCYGYILVATGRAEIAIDSVMNPWDCGPFVTILQEAGGRFTNWAGEPTVWGPDAVATNAALHDEVLAILRSEKRR